MFCYYYYMRILVVIDMVINFLLGFLLVLKPSTVLKLIFTNSPVSLFLIVIVGIVLFLFACWQLYLLINGVNEKIIRILGCLALIPAVLLTLFLIYYFGSVSLLGKYLLVAGCVYMYILGVLYSFSGSQ